MKILHVISQRPDSTGSGMYLQNMIRQAAAAGHENFLVAGLPVGESPEIPGLADDAIIPVTFAGGDLPYPIPGMSDVMPYPSSVFGRLSAADLDAYERVFADRIRQAVECFAPDIVHSHHLWIATAVARRTAPLLPLATSCHSTALRQFLQCPHIRERVLEACRDLDRVLSLSRDQAGKIGEMYGLPADRIDIVGGGYDQELFTWAEKSASPSVHLLAAGKLSFAKGVDWLLRSCERLAGLPLHLHLAGSGAGDEAAACLALAERSPIQVTVHGRIGQQELAALMRSCHVFVLPSFYEGLPLVLLEALASGCRIVTTDLPGCTELLADAGPDLVEFVRLPPLQTVDQPYIEDRDALESDLAAAIARMTELVRDVPTPHRDEISGIVKNFGWKAVFSRVAESYRKAIGRRS